MSKKKTKPTLLEQAYQEVEKDRQTVKDIYKRTRPDIPEEEVEKMVSGMSVDHLIQNVKKFKPLFAEYKAFKGKKPILTVDHKRPIVFTGETNKANQYSIFTARGEETPKGRLTSAERLEQFKKVNELQEQFKDFPVLPIDTAVKTASLARAVFDAVYYPLKTIIPDVVAKEFGGWKEVIFKTYNGKKNSVRYYCKNEVLTNAQCRVLHLERNLTSVYGYTINDKPISNENFKRYLYWVDNFYSNLEKKKVFSHTVRSIPAVPTGRFRHSEHIHYRPIKVKVADELTPPTPTNPDGSRKPSIIQSGVNSFMENNNINNPVKMIPIVASGKSNYRIADYQHATKMFQELNITAQEAFEYVCRYVNKNRDIKRLHMEDREAVRGGSALKTLIDYYYAECERRLKQKKNGEKVKLFSYPQLRKSEAYKSYIKQSGDTIMGSDDSFKRWFNARLKALTVKK